MVEGLRPTGSLAGHSRLPPVHTHSPFRVLPGVCSLTCVSSGDFYLQSQEHYASLFSCPRPSASVPAGPVIACVPCTALGFVVLTSLVSEVHSVAFDYQCQASLLPST